MVFGLFSKEKSLEKTIAKATNKLAQQVDRWSALERLKEDGSDEALFGLCKRFGITSTKSVEDEAEKNWVVDTLVAAGSKALAPLVRYMGKAEQLAFPLRVLERIADRKKVLEVADQLFASEPPGYVRMPERRIDLFRWFSEWTLTEAQKLQRQIEELQKRLEELQKKLDEPKRLDEQKKLLLKELDELKKDQLANDDELISRLSPYVSDFDENSRFAAFDGMAGRDPAKIGPPLIAALIRPEEESGRIKRTIVEVLEKSRAPLGDQADAVAAVLTGPLADEFKVESGLVRKR